ncbi:D-glycero-alpha-D-manno-heptose-1,7-bisphosphate 7-phosphatase [Fontivita pretiosa]|uniref:D-glycero-alpha-D-manno-heptose-1,7-bisphosphate 7-phosphatase n=1 Tax=Fontivita pretiosa TaxID=2989684 RepID=UPI003D186417
MRRPAIFFDRDNTIIVSDGYLGDPEKVVLMQGAADAVARARSLGFATVVVSNQSGVARGLFSEDDVCAVNRRIDELLLRENPAAVIDRHEYCPFHPDGTVERYRRESELRKPNPGMILRAAEQLALDLSRSWVIGDAPRDIRAGKAAGCRTILLRPEGIPQSPAASERLTVQPDQVVSSLKEAMDHVEQSLGDSPPPTPTSNQPADATNEQDGASQASAPPPAATQATAPAPQVQHLLEQILHELRTRNERDARAEYADFSVSKLMAGIAQVLALALVLLSYLNRNDASFTPLMLFAIYVQTLTIALLIMGRQK